MPKVSRCSSPINKILTFDNQNATYCLHMKTPLIKASHIIYTVLLVSIAITCKKEDNGTIAIKEGDCSANYTGSQIYTAAYN